MELYTLDGLFRRAELVEGFESFIWTERYSDLGDLSIITPSSSQYRNLMASGTFMGLSESRRVMKIETLEDAEAEDGSKKLTITAKEITDVLNDRIAQTGVAGFKENSWSATGKPSDIIRTLFDYICRNGLASPTDVIPLLDAASLYVAGNIPEDLTVYAMERPYGSLFEAIKEIADIFDLGFRLYKGEDDSKLYFDVYKGNDRTSSQSIIPAVIFAESLDSLQQVSELTSVAKSKNVAHVQGVDRVVTVYSDGSSVTTSGFAKRVMYVDATDISFVPRSNVITLAQETAINKAVALTSALVAHKNAMQKLLDRVRFDSGEAALITAFTTAAVTATTLTAGDKTNIDAAVSASSAIEVAENTAMDEALTDRGNQELAKNRSISAFDGVITQLSPYKINRDYDMGDLVEMRNSLGLTNQMLVTEQIFVSDASGERAFPTLTIKRFITPGSWLAWENTQVWQDAPGTWATS